jgi:3-oxoacyl-[acyl-carrier protein] reductase
MGLLEGKRAFVTGGTRGIGRAICEVFAREGADVAFNYNSRPDLADEAVAAIEAYGRKALSYQVSVTDAKGVKDMAKDVITQWDGIDILVNNAAINRGDNFATTSEKHWLDVVNTNVNGLFYVTKPFYRQMMRQRSGYILNITSIAAIRAVPTSVHYSTAKAAVVGFTKCLSKEAGTFGVIVNAIAAGMFDTDLGHSLPDHFQAIYETWSTAHRFGQPKELAEFAAFMVSERNTYMMGEVVTIDGGAVV